MISDFKFKQRYSIQDLLEIMELLRGENGCNWDREQDHHTIRGNLIEECYEVADAIDQDSPDMLKEELGDVLLQVVFHSRMSQEAGDFCFDDVCDGICKKLVHRHPHVFGDTVVANSDEVLANWEKIKREEKSQSTYTSSLEAVPKAFPALMRAQKVQKRAGKSGFDYADAQGAIGDLKSELDEVSRAMRGDGDIDEEIGDLLFSAVNVARMLKVPAEDALQRSTDKFTERFARVEELAAKDGINLSAADSKALDILWNKAKH